MKRSRPLGALAIAGALALGGCATIPRAPATTGMQATAFVPGYDTTIRYWADGPVESWTGWRTKWLAARSQAGAQSPFAMLAISSGSDKGAFAAGYLNGWSSSGTRPAFALVTGVSTGALIAPFAFIGRTEDDVLRLLYTDVDAKDIFRRSPLRGVLGGPSFADTRPLARLIARHVTDELVDNIAEAHRSGRRLLVMTTNLDAQRGVVWDLGEIAASRAPGRAELIRDVLLASASIPGVFPPVRIQVRSGGQTFDELHVDGGTTNSVFVIPDSLLSTQDAEGLATTINPEMTLLYNGVLSPRYERVEASAFNVIARALETVIGAGDRRAVGSYQAFARQTNLRLCIEAIPSASDPPSAALFDRRYMQRLFAIGEEAGVNRQCRS